MPKARHRRAVSSIGGPAGHGTALSHQESTQGRRPAGRHRRRKKRPTGLVPGPRLNAVIAVSSLAAVAVVPAVAPPEPDNAALTRPLGHRDHRRSGTPAGGDGSARALADGRERQPSRGRARSAVAPSADGDFPAPGGTGDPVSPGATGSEPAGGSRPGKHRAEGRPDREPGARHRRGRHETRAHERSRPRGAKRDRGRSAHVPLTSKGPWLPAGRIADAVGASPRQVAANWPLLDRALRQAGMHDLGTRVAAVATVVTEVGHDFRPINEYGGRGYFTSMYEGRSDLGNTRRGDGARFHGRGYIQLTGRANYRTYGRRLGVPLERNPDLALRPAVAARVLATYFRERGVGAAARRGHWLEVRRAVNGGLNGWTRFEGAVTALLAATQH